PQRRPAAALLEHREDPVADPEGGIAPSLLLHRLGQREADGTQTIRRRFRHGRLLHRVFCPHVVPVRLGPALDQLLQRGVRLLRQHDLELHILVAALAGGSPLEREAAALQAQVGARAGALRNRHRDHAVDRRHRDLGAEYGLVQGHRQFEMHVVVLPREKGMRLDTDLDQRIARLAAIDAGIALVAQPDLLTVGETGRNGDVELLAVGHGEAPLGAAGSVHEGDLQAEAAVGAALRHGGAARAGTGTAAAHLAENLVEDVVAGAGVEAAVTERSPRAAEAAAEPAGARAAARMVTAAESLGARLSGGIDFAAIEFRALLRI